MPSGYLVSIPFEFHSYLEICAKFLLNANSDTAYHIASTCTTLLRLSIHSPTSLRTESSLLSAPRSSSRSCTLLSVSAFEQAKSLLSTLQAYRTQHAWDLGDICIAQCEPFMPQHYQNCPTVESHNHLSAHPVSYSTMSEPISPLGRRSKRSSGPSFSSGEVDCSASATSTGLLTTALTPSFATHMLQTFDHTSSQQQAQTLATTATRHENAALSLSPHRTQNRNAPSICAPSESRTGEAAESYRTDDAAITAHGGEDSPFPADLWDMFVVDENAWL